MPCAVSQAGADSHARLPPVPPRGTGWERAARTQPALRPACGADARTSPRVPQRRAEAHAAGPAAAPAFPGQSFALSRLSRSGRMRIFVIWSEVRLGGNPRYADSSLAQRTLALPSIDAQQALQMLVFRQNAAARANELSHLALLVSAQPTPSCRAGQRWRRRSAPSPGGGGSWASGFSRGPLI
jgi:hypothetical protein